MVPLNASEVLRRLLRQQNSLLLRPWFTRLWFVQEIALPAWNPPLFFAGRSYYDLQSLYCISWFLEKYKGMNVTPVLRIARLFREKNSLVVLRDTQQPWNISATSGAQVIDLSFTEDLSHRFMMIQSLLRDFTTSFPHDYVYAILGLCGPNPLPLMMAPKYDKPFAEVYKDYAVATIEATWSLRVLPRRKNCLVDVPSSVPDFFRRQQ